MDNLHKCYDKIRADLTTYVSKHFPDDENIKSKVKKLNITPIRIFSEQVQLELKPHLSKDGSVDVAAIKKILSVDSSITKEQLAKLNSFANLFILLSNDVLGIKQN